MSYDDGLPGNRASTSNIRFISQDICLARSCLAVPIKIRPPGKNWWPRRAGAICVEGRWDSWQDNKTMVASRGRAGLVCRQHHFAMLPVVRQKMYKMTANYVNGTVKQRSATFERTNRIAPLFATYVRRNGKQLALSEPGVQVLNFKLDCFWPYTECLTYPKSFCPPPLAAAPKNPTSKANRLPRTGTWLFVFDNTHKSHVS